MCSSKSSLDNLKCARLATSVASFHSMSNYESTYILKMYSDKNVPVHIVDAQESRCACPEVRACAGPPKPPTKGPTWREKVISSFTFSE